MTPIVVITTTKSPEQAEIIANALLEKRLAACIQIIPSIKSMFRWKGAVEIEQESLCLIKTSQELFEDVEKAIKTDHSYETPEIVALPIDRISSEYKEWLSAELTGN